MTVKINFEVLFYAIPDCFKQKILNKTLIL